MNERYHILSLEAKEICKQEEDNGVGVGYKLPSTKDYAYFNLFKNVIDYSLDLIELKNCYYSKCRNKFSFEDEPISWHSKAMGLQKEISLFKP